MMLAKKLAMVLSTAYDKAAKNDPDLTKRKLARLAGVSDSQIGRIITGERRPYADEFVAIAKALGVSPQSVWVVATDSAGADQETIALIEAINRMPIEKRREVVNLLRKTVEALTVPN